MRTHGVYIPSDYYRELKFKKNNRTKARAFMEYYDDNDMGEHNSVRFYANSWGVAIGTAHGWIDDFKTEIDRYYAARQLKNDKHYNYAKKQNEHFEQNRMNTLTTSSSDNIGIVDNHTEQSEQKEMNKGLTASLSNNIYVESNDSDKNKSSSKNRISYSNNFEIIWQEYDKKSGNKERAFKIYQKKYKNVDIKLMIEAIKEYKSSKEEWRDLKDFDGFLNGMIDIYLPKRAWIKDKFGNQHLGHFYDSKNLFISDEHSKLPLQSSNITEYIANKRFGYIGA